MLYEEDVHKFCAIHLELRVGKSFNKKSGACAETFRRLPCCLHDCMKMLHSFVASQGRIEMSTQYV